MGRGKRKMVWLGGRSRKAKIGRVRKRNRNAGLPFALQGDKSVQLQRFPLCVQLPATV